MKSHKTYDNDLEVGGGGGGGRIEERVQFCSVLFPGRAGVEWSSVSGGKIRRPGFSRTLLFQSLQSPTFHTPLVAQIAHSSSCDHRLNKKNIKAVFKKDV